MDVQNNNNTTEEKNTPEVGAEAGKHEKGLLMGVLAYLGPLVIIPYMVAEDNPFVKFHIKQGLVLLAFHVILWVLTPMFFLGMWGIVKLINLALTVLSIIGIVNVLQKKERMLPIVGGLSSYLKF